MTYRPTGPRIVAYVAGGCLVAMFIAVSVALPADIRSEVTPSQLITLLAILLVFLAALFAIARTRVETHERGLHIVNGYRSHDLEWAEVIAIELGRGAPWAVVDTSSGGTVSMMAIQNSDGAGARRALAAIRAEVDAHS